MATIIQFPGDEMATPPAISNLELARLLIEEWRRKREDPEPAERLTAAAQAPALPLVASSGDVPSRSGQGWTDWAHLGRVLRHRRMELEYPAAGPTLPEIIAVERQARRLLGG